MFKTCKYQEESGETEVFGFTSKIMKDVTTIIARLKSDLRQWQNTVMDILDSNQKKNEYAMVDFKERAKDVIKKSQEAMVLKINESVDGTVDKYLNETIKDMRQDVKAATK